MSEIPPRGTAPYGILSAAAKQLRAAGVGSPESDARQLLAHVLGLEPGRLPLVASVDDTRLQTFRRLVERRAARVPLQHLTGVAYFRHEQLVVGPGVFVPRPETEVLTGWVVETLRRLVDSGRSPLVVDLCAGSGVIAKSLAAEVSGARIHAVEMSEDAAEWARRNLSGTGVELHVADMAAALPELNGLVDLVVANPPYIPLDAFLSVTPEVRDHDPALALFSGPDGLDAMRVVAQVGGRLLTDGGLLAAEHADLQGKSAPAVFIDSGEFAAVRDHVDLAGRPRFVTAVRRRRTSEG